MGEMDAASGPKPIPAPVFALARVLLALIFVMSGAGKIFSFTDTAAFMADHRMPVAPLFLVGAIVFEIVGGVLIMLGYKTRIGALMLIVFLIPTTVIFHEFWGLGGDEARAQMIHFMKNVSILGGLLLLYSHGPGPLSVDSRGAASRQE